LAAAWVAVKAFEAQRSRRTDGEIVWDPAVEVELPLGESGAPPELLSARRVLVQVEAWTKDWTWEQGRRVEDAILALPLLGMGSVLPGALRHLGQGIQRRDLASLVMAAESFVGARGVSAIEIQRAQAERLQRWAWEA